MKPRNSKKFIRRWKTPTKWTIFSLTLGVVLATVGSIAALNGWFGGGGSIPEDTMTRGLVGYWGFEEGSGTTAHDASDYANTGTLKYMATGTDAWTKGKVGSALSFDGADDYVSVADSASLDITNAITIEAWVKSTVSSGSLTKLDRLLEKNESYTLDFNHDNWGKGNFGFKWGTTGSEWANLQYSTTLPANTWIHLVGTYDGQNMRVYLNGVQDNSVAETRAIVTNNNSAYIGTYNGTAGTYNFSGLMDEVRIYNRALSAEEIRFHYNRGGPVAQWKMDEGEGRTVYDSTNNNNDGTLVLAGSATSSAWVSGKYGSALAFDGVDDYVSVANDSSLNFDGGSFSAEAWINLSSAASATGIVVSKAFNSGMGFQLYTYIDGRGFDMYYNKGNGYIEVYNQPGANVSRDVWHHIVGIYSSSANTVYLYIDGTLIGSDSSYTASAGMGSVSSLTIGKKYNDTLPFNGLIDDVHIYNYARTPDEIRLDYNAGFAAKFGYTAAGCQRDPAACMTQGLVGYWDMEEGTGATIHDRSDNANNGTTTNMTTPWTSGIVPLSGGKSGGSALSFDGTDDYIAKATPNFPTGSSPRTISYWFKANSFSGLDVNVFYGDSAATANANFWVGFNSTDIYTSFSGGSNEITQSWTPNTGQWYYLVGIWDGSALKTYLDGVLYDSGTGFSPNTEADVLRIGGIYDIDNQYQFNGILDEVRIYNRALSAEEIRFHYNKGGPVAQWKFDEGEGRTAYDSTENNNDGTLVLAGSATSSAWVQGKYGSALNFDGADDYVDAGNDTSLRFTGSFTAEAWVNRSVVDVGHDVVGRYNTATNERVWDLRFGSNNTLALAVSGDGSTGILETTSNTFTSGVWYHVVGVYDSSVPNIKVYVNGKLEPTSTSGGTIPSSLYNPDTKVFIGAWENPTLYFNGLIDEVRIYNYARTPDEIRLDYNAGFAAKFGYTAAGCQKDPATCMTQGLVGYWGFEEGSGTIAHDSSNYANNATTAGTAPSWTKGKVGGALSFDGTDDYVDAGSGASLNITGDLTIALWLKKDGTQYPFFIAKDISGGNTQYQFYGRPDSTDQVLHFLSGATVVDGTVNVSNNAWHHVAVTRSGTTISFYVDGVFDISRTIAAPASSATNFNIGRDSDTSHTYSNGTIDEVRIYNRALSPEEIRYHYNKGGPVAQWKMDEGEGRVVYDSTDNNNDGTLVLAGSATSSAWVAGKYGSALSFDGTDDYVDAGKISMVSWNGITTEAWIKYTEGTKSDEYTIISNWDNTNADILLRIEPTGDYVEAFIGLTGGAVTGGAFSDLVVDSNWHHIILTYDTTNGFKAYLDGVVSSTIYSANGSLRSVASTNNFWIGRNPFVPNTDYWNGLIDEVRVYNYARTAEQIRQDYNAGLSTYFK